MFKQFYDDNDPEVTEKPVPWYAVVQVKDVLFALLLFSVTLVGFHAWYHQQQEIEVLQNHTDYLNKVFQYMQHFSAGPQ